MSLPAKSPPALPTISHAQIKYGNNQDCSQTHALDAGNGLGHIGSSIDFKVDDTHAPDHFMVKVTYGLFYKPDGWSYKSYTLKLWSNVAGDLHHEIVDGDDKNLISRDTHAQAGPFIMVSDSFRLYFYCRTRYLGDSIDSQNGRQMNLFTQDMKSLCLKTS